MSDDACKCELLVVCISNFWNLGIEIEFHIYLNEYIVIVDYVSLFSESQKESQSSEQCVVNGKPLVNDRKGRKRIVSSESDDESVEVKRKERRRVKKKQTCPVGDSESSSTDNNAKTYIKNDSDSQWSSEDDMPLLRKVMKQNDSDLWSSDDNLPLRDMLIWKTAGVDCVNDCKPHTCIYMYVCL